MLILVFVLPERIFTEAFTERYIGTNGRAYVARYKLSPEKAIKIIKEAAGIPIVAHPAGFSSNGFQLNKDDILKLKEKGLMGMILPPTLYKIKNYIIIQLSFIKTVL